MLLPPALPNVIPFVRDYLAGRKARRQTLVISEEVDLSECGMPLDAHYLLPENLCWLKLASKGTRSARHGNLYLRTYLPIITIAYWSPAPLKVVQRNNREILYHFDNLNPNDEVLLHIRTEKPGNELSKTLEVVRLTLEEGLVLGPAGSGRDRGGFSRRPKLSHA